jgi:hypothetical protein
MGITLLVAGLALGQTLESRTLTSTDPVSKATRVVFMERVQAGKRFILMGRDLLPGGSIAYGYREYDMSGAPLVQWQEGEWGGRLNRFETTYEKDQSTLNLNGEKTVAKVRRDVLRDPTKLWFWRVKPKVGETVTVTILAQNRPATFKIKYTYEGDEEMELAGRRAKLHRVREDPVGTPGVYTLWWYDEVGMGVRRYHKTTEHEYTDELKSWH